MAREKNLDELLVHKYYEKISGQARHFATVEVVGPTSDAAQHYVFWIYDQIQEWRGDNALDPLKWGWQLTNRGIMPIEMTKQVVPSELLKIVKCDCRRTVHVDIMDLFAQTLLWVVGECPA